MASTGAMSEPLAGTVTVADLRKTLQALEAALSTNGDYLGELSGLVEQVRAQIPKGPDEPKQRGAWVEASAGAVQGRRDFYRCGTAGAPWVANGARYRWDQLVDPVIRTVSAGDNPLRARIRRLRDNKAWHAQDLKAHNPGQARVYARWAEQLTKALDEDPFEDDSLTDLIMRWEAAARDLRAKARQWNSSPHAIKLGFEAEAYEDRALELKQALRRV